MKSILEIAASCNSVGDIEEVIEREGLYRFLVGGALAGQMAAGDVTALKGAAGQFNSRAVFAIDDTQHTVQFSEWCGDRTTRTAAMAAVLARLRKEDAWASLRKWRNELYPVYGDASDADNVAVMIERAASYNFGIRTYGVHVNGIRRSEGTGAVEGMWVARRSPNKPTWPGFLDQIAAGGIGDGAGVRESMIKECGEEAGIPRELAEAGARLAGTIQYFTRSALGLQPETQYVYDLELPAHFVPEPRDGEVESFEFLSLDKVLDRVRRGEFKPNCAMCVADFLVRHGVLTPENEPDYLAILDHLHCPLPYSAPTTVSPRSAL
ncbi:hypothetical protein GGI04_004664 [Coemansia thaxteri]|nr:hypothetical protein GGI04_004664 [Coemansia thaxteri]